MCAGVMSSSLPADRAIRTNRRRKLGSCCARSSALLFKNRNPDQDDWSQGLKDRDKATGRITIKGFSSDVAGKDVVIFEDMIESGGTACELARFLKKVGVRSVTFMVTSGLFTSN